MRIEVTQADIDKANQELPNNCRSECCPVAQAFIRAGFKDISVGDTTASWGTGAVILPREVSETIRFFDRSGKMLPFSFEIDGLEPPK